MGLPSVFAPIDSLTQSGPERTNNHTSAPSVRRLLRVMTWLYIEGD